MSFEFEYRIKVFSEVVGPVMYGPGPLLTSRSPEQIEALDRIGAALGIDMEGYIQGAKPGSPERCRRVELKRGLEVVRDRIPVAQVIMKTRWR
ncbi:MAG: hypothetical protein ABH867_01965 [Patescibacteria group bacterium]|nr:hypothetical protein [Patescibacteria group bacterium]